MDLEQTQEKSTNAAQDASDASHALSLVPIRRRWFRGRRREPEPQIQEVMAQWAEYQMIFNDILQRLSAQLARQAKMEKKRLDKIASEIPVQLDMIQAQETPKNTKQALRTQYAATRFGGRIQAILNAKDQDHEPNSQSR